MSQTISSNEATHHAKKLTDYFKGLNGSRRVKSEISLLSKISEKLNKINQEEMIGNLDKIAGRPLTAAEQKTILSILNK